MRFAALVAIALLAAGRESGPALAQSPPVERFAVRPRVAPGLEVKADSLRHGRAVSRVLSAESSLQPESQLRVLAVMRSDAGRAALEEAGLMPRSVVGRVASLSVTPEELSRLADLPGVVSLRAPQVFRANLDVNGIENGAAAVRQMGARGKGVLIAVIDSGVDFRHADFRDADGKTRIVGLWDQFDSSYRISGGTVGSAPPARDASGHPLGTLYTEEQIDAALAGVGVVNAVDLPGHGTLAASAAAGNGLATGNGQPVGVYVGTAPEASLLVVRIGGEDKDDLSFSGDVISALEWIDARADELQMPVVVNMSFGSHAGPHDGSTAEELAIDAFVQKPGRAVTASAGNEGDADIHARGSTLGSRTVEVFQGGESSVVFLDCWIPGGDRVDLGFADPSGKGVFDLNAGVDQCAATTRSPNRVTSCLGAVDPVNGDREVVFFVEPATSRAPISAGAWRFTLRDEGGVHDGRFDCWSALGQDITTDIDGGNRVSQPATARGAIAVGASTARTTWPSMAGPSKIPAQLGSRAFFSSPGPTRDGRVKPELVTGGYAVVGAWSIADGTGSGLPGVPPRIDLVAPDGVHIASSGTSFSAPQVAGAVALLFEHSPGLSAEQVRTALITTARADQSTGSVPNDAWGYGKLDVAAALAALGGGCRADCDQDGTVSIGDLQIGLNLFFGADVSACPTMDVAGDGIQLDDLQLSLSEFFDGCLH